MFALIDCIDYTVTAIVGSLESVDSFTLSMSLVTYTDGLEVGDQVEGGFPCL